MSLADMVKVERFRMRKGNRWVVRYRARFGDGLMAYEGPAAETEARAKQALLEAAARALEGSYLPQLYRFGRYVAVIYRTPDGWWYEIIDDQTPTYEGSHRLRPGTVGRFESAEEAERALRRHMAQLLMDPRRGYTAEEIVDPRDLESHRSYYRWQLGYAAARDAGLPDEVCRQVAERYNRGESLEVAITEAVFRSQ